MSQGENSSENSPKSEALGEMLRINWRRILSERQTALSESITTLKAVPAIGLGAYVTGFVAINAHLSKYGVFDFDLANSRYLIVGALFFIFIALLCFFTGRILYEEWLSEESDDPNSDYTILDVWAGIIFSWARIIFSICISAALFSLTFLGSTEPILFCIYSAVLVGIRPKWDDMWEGRGLFERFPLIDVIVDPIARTVGVVIFFTTIDIPSPTMTVFFQIALISVYGIFILRLFKEFQSSGEEFTRTIIHSTIFVLLTSASFGWLQYAHIKSGFGGGQLQATEIIVVDQTVSKGLEEMGFEVTPTFKVNLVYEKQEELIVTVKDKTIRLSKTTIAGFQALSVEAGNWQTYFRDLKNKLEEAWARVRLSK